MELMNQFKKATKNKSDDIIIELNIPHPYGLERFI